MATATVIVTSEPEFTPGQSTSISQGTENLETGDSPFFTAHVSPAYVYKMRTWDTVAGAYVYWTSFGDANTRPPTLNPVIGTTAVRMNRPRTV